MCALMPNCQTRIHLTDIGVLKFAANAGLSFQFLEIYTKENNQTDN